MSNTDDNDRLRLTRRELLGLPAALLAAQTALGSPGSASLAKRATGKVREVENTWIPMPDGIRLAARIWLPDTAERHPVPAILNYCPYFARIFTRALDDARFPYYASHGYACIRVDIRGSGNSDGRPMDEYVRQEQDDGTEIIKWISRQPWCDGVVGMEGYSWSGFNSLQVAARQPAALKAVVAHCFTDDRYRDDAHYKGGCVIDDMFNWGAMFLAFQGQPSDPAITGETAWRTSWLERLNAVEFNLDKWLDHPHRDEFWKHGSVGEDYSQIKCPVYAIGGWTDSYKNSIFRLMTGLKTPRKALIGPWTHGYPHQGVPGPAIGYLDEALRWWDYWLKGRSTGIMDEPMLRVWMQEAADVQGTDPIEGYWAAEDRWPSPRILAREFFLTGDLQLTLEATPEKPLSHNPIQTIGLASGKWCPSDVGDIQTELPFDQRVDDARSLSFDSAPLEQSFEMLGACKATLNLAVDQPVAFIAVRLCEVLPTGESERVTYGLLNLCHRDSHESPSPLIPGRRYTVSVGLDHMAHVFHAGNRLRLSISTACWPLMFPSPAPVRLTLFAGSSRVALPVRPKRLEDAHLAPFGAPYVPPVAVESVNTAPGRLRVEWDGTAHRQQVERVVGDGVARLAAIDTRVMGKSTIRADIGETDTHAVYRNENILGWQHGRFNPRCVATTEITTQPTEFLLRGQLDAFDGEEKVFSRVWERRIPRQLV